jgi:hypothetical protein
LVKLCICNSFYFFDCFVQNLHPQVQKVGTNLQYLYVFHILRPRVLNCILKCAIHDYNDEHLSKIIDVLVPHSFFSPHTTTCLTSIYTTPNARLCRLQLSLSMYFQPSQMRYLNQLIVRCFKVLYDMFIGVFD